LEQPLRALAQTARRLGIGALYYKDESERFGRRLASFKALGAPYAVYSLLADTVEAERGVRPSSAQLRADGGHRCSTCGEAPTSRHWPRCAQIVDSASSIDAASSKMGTSCRSLSRLRVGPGSSGVASK
jgi:hypothetical protein